MRGLSRFVRSFNSYSESCCVAVVDTNVVEANRQQSERRVIGFMSGTSMDSIDAALVVVRGKALHMTVEFVTGASLTFGPERDVLRDLASGAPVSALTATQAIRAFSQRHRELGLQLIQAHGPVDLLAIHGQTIVHQPPLSWQALLPWEVAQGINAPVVSDLRAADISVGGQGAPITPLADWILFRDESASRAIVNLGGFCNVTTLPAGGAPEDIRACDVCACNLVLDAVARRALGADFDVDGAAAARGCSNEDAARALDSLLESQSRDERSLGTGDEATTWVDAWRDTIPPDDLAASAAQAVGAVIGRALQDVDAVYLAGGGANNRALVASIDRASSTKSRPLDELGIQGAWREAVEMAVLGCLCQDGVPITLPHITGATAPMVAGVWTNLR